MSSHPHRTAMVLATLILLVANPAHAVTRSVFSQGAANCQSALPVFDGAIRKRPRAVANEGSGTAFITCAFENTPNADKQVTKVRVDLYNTSGTEVMLGCTLVNGYRTFEYSPSITRSRVVAPGAAASFEWATVDNNGFGFTSPALSCLLPAGTEISATRLDYLES